MFNIFVVLLALVTTAVAGAELRDPTQPPGAAQEQASSRPDPSAGLVLESVFRSQDRRLAIINGELVREGQTVDGARIVEIRSDAVDIRTSAGQATLTLDDGQSVRQTSD